jgi:hypothetical protein
MVERPNGLNSGKKPVINQQIKYNTTLIPLSSVLVTHYKAFLMKARPRDQSWLRSSEQFPRFDKCRSAGFEVLRAA